MEAVFLQHRKEQMHATCFSIFTDLRLMKRDSGLQATVVVRGKSVKNTR
jgi:hypothetical protein